MEVWPSLSPGLKTFEIYLPEPNSTNRQVNAPPTNSPPLHKPSQLLIARLPFTPHPSSVFPTKLNYLHNFYTLPSLTLYIQWQKLLFSSNYGNLSAYVSHSTTPLYFYSTNPLRTPPTVLSLRVPPLHTVPIRSTCMRTWRGWKTNAFVYSLPQYAQRPTYVRSNSQLPDTQPPATPALPNS